MTDFFHEPTLREKLGGRWALSWQAYAITVPLAILTLVAWARSPAEVAWWIAIGLIAIGVVGAWNYLMHRTGFRNRVSQPVPLTRVFASGIVAVTLFIFVSLALGTVVGVSEPGRLVPNPAPTFIFALGWGITLTLILESQWRFRMQRNQLLEQAVQQRLAALQENDLLDQIRLSIRSQVNEELTAARDRIEHRIDSLIEQDVQTATILAQELKSTADATVRPLSHRLERQARRRHPAPSIFTVLINIARFQPFRPLAVSIVYLLTVTATEISRYGFALGVGLIALTVALIFATMSLVNVAMRRWPEHHTALFVGGIAFVQVPTVALAPLRAHITGVPTSAFDMVVAFVLGSILIVATSAFGAWNRSHQEAVREFTAEVQEDELQTLARSEAIAQTAHEAAVILHGGIQSRLRACAAALEAANRSGDPVGINRALVQARAILAEELPDLSSHPCLVLTDVVDQKASEWKGLLEITIHIDESLREQQGPIARHIGEVVEEGIANAVHHGGAQRVQIAITDESDEVCVLVSDDGSGPQQGSKGLGSRIFDAMNATWSLTGSASRGSTLEVRLPFRVDSPLEAATLEGNGNVVGSDRLSDYGIPSVGRGGGAEFEGRGR